MKNPVYAPAVKAPYFFDESVRWIHAKGVSNFSVQMFRASFTLDVIPKEAVLLAMAANYAEIFINGKAAASLAVRSYIFDKAYEVYDVTSYLQVGKNIIAVQNIDTGEEIRAGFALEIKADGKTVCATNDNFVYKCEEAFEGAINYTISGGGEERVNAEKLTDGYTEVNFDDSDWLNAEVIGNELLHAPYDRFHQSMIEGQTADVCYAKSFAAVMRADKPCGYSLRLGPSNEGVTLAMTKLSLVEDAEMTFVIGGGVRSIAIDGKQMPLNEKCFVKKGEHFCVIAFAWTADFLIRTEAELAFDSLIGDEKPLAAYLFRTPPVRYPWNEYRGRNKNDDIIDAILSVNTFDDVSEEIKESLVPMDFAEPNGVGFSILSLDRSVPKNGFAEKRIYADNRVCDSENEIVFENKESLLSEHGAAVIPAQEGIVNFILDFETERVGRVAFEVDAPKGTVVDVVAFEMITDEGIKMMNNGSVLRYVCKEGKQEYICRRQRGFRYLSVYVYGNASDVTIHDIHVVETRYPVDEGEFVCSDERLNTIYKMSTRTAEVCMLDLYCDCPGYEQNPWTGDARCTAQVNLFNFGAYDFDEQYLKLIANSIDDGLWLNYRRRNPRYINKLYLPCACFPTYPEGCIPVWSMMWLLQIEDHYRVTGDKKFLAELFSAVKETLNRFVRMTDDRGLFDMQGAWNLIEWANNDLDFYGEVTANNAMLSYCFKKSAEMAGVLGETALAEEYLAKAEAYKNAVNTYCWDEGKRAYVDTVRDVYAYERYLAYMAERNMPTVSYEEYVKNGRISVQTNTMALLYDCVPAERHDDAIRFLLDNMKSGLYVSGTPANRVHGDPSEEEAPDGYVHIGSPFFLYFALKTLYKYGYDDLALLSQRRDWGVMLDSDIPTCIETFKKGKAWTRSAAHAWSASPAIFLKTDVLGVKAVKAGYEEFSIEPKTSDLTFAKGSVPTPHGKIYVEWKKNEDGSIDIHYEAPSGCKKV